MQPPTINLSGCFAKDRSFVRRSRLLGLIAMAECFTATLGLAQRLTPLSATPDWKILETFQETMTRQEFVTLLEGRYAPDHASRAWIEVGPSSAKIREDRGRVFTLRFAIDPTHARAVTRYWRPIAPHSGNPDQPMAGVHVALDPGHLGGEWAKMEERWFQVGPGVPVAEGDLTLRVAQLVAPRLRSLGARVSFVRSEPGPTTSDRPANLQIPAIDALHDRGVHVMRREPSGINDPAKDQTISWEAEKLFYRISEIQHRAVIVNQHLRPDLCICLHFNAEPWGNTTSPRLVETNHLHVIVNGSYTAGELAYDDVRFAMLCKLFNRGEQEEQELAEATARAMREATDLPAFHYATENARSVGGSGYVWARNLIANRLYQCPVVYVECYVMNSRIFYERLQAGEYEGRRFFDGRWRQNIFAEYTDGLVNGLVDYLRQPANDFPPSWFLPGP